MKIPNCTTVRDSSHIVHRISCFALTTPNFAALPSTKILESSSNVYSRSAARHKGNAKYWYGNVGRGKGLRQRNLRVLLTEPEAKAQVVLDQLCAVWDATQESPRKPPAMRPLDALFREYRAIKDGHYRDSRRGFDGPAQRVGQILRECKLRFVADINARVVMDYIEGRRGPKFGAVTAEHYRRDFKGFCRWLLDEGHIDRPVFGRRDRFRGEQHHKRRALTPDEQRRLLDAAHRGRAYGRRKNVSGPARRLIYWTAISTGYRMGEMKALTIACCSTARTRKMATTRSSRRSGINYSIFANISRTAASSSADIWLIWSAIVAALRTARFGWSSSTRMTSIAAADRIFVTLRSTA